MIQRVWRLRYARRAARWRLQAQAAQAVAFERVARGAVLRYVTVGAMMMVARNTVRNDNIHMALCC